MDRVSQAVRVARRGATWVVTLFAIVAAPAAASAASPDPERTLGSPTGWHWYRDRSAPQLTNAVEGTGDRLIDVDVVGHKYTAATVRNTGPFASDASGGWFRGKSRDQVVDLTEGEGKRLIDLEPYVKGGKLRFTGLRVPNAGNAAKGWWWNYNLTSHEVTDDINEHDIRLIDLERYEKGGKNRYAYVGIKNQGVDAAAWWWYPGISAKRLGEKLDENGARLIDVERLSNGKLAAVMIKSDGTYWGWWHNVSQTRMEQLYAMHGLRVVDVEQFKKGGKRRFSLIGVNVVGGETARLRALLDDVFEKSETFGNGVSAGAYVKQLGGPRIAGLAESVRFQPYSTLKLLPYAFAIDHVDRAAPPPGDDSQTTLDSKISWIQAAEDDPDTDKFDESVDLGCLKAGDGNETGSAALENALQTMMWESHNRTLDAVMEHFDRKPRKKDDYLWKGITGYVNALGLTRTKMHQGCPDDNGDSPWLANRSTLADLTTLYEKVDNGTAYSNASSRQAFADLMINVDFDGYSPDYGITNNVSPITGRDAKSPYSLPGWMKTIVTEEADPSKFSIVDDFFELIRYRGKGGSADVSLGDGEWESGWSGQTWAELPINDGAAYRDYALGWWVNGVHSSDDGCKWDGTGTLTCAAIWNEEVADRNRLDREVWREPIRRALDTWSTPTENQPPVPTIIQPKDTSYQSTSVVPLRGSAVDPEGDPITYKWTATQNGTDYNLGNSKNIDWIPRNTLGPRSPGVYQVVLTLRVSDGSASRTAQKTISIVYPTS